MYGRYTSLSEDEETHLKRIEEVLKRLAEVNLKIKVTKCQFFTKKVKFLGFTISEEGMRMDEGRIESLKQMPYPENKKQLQAFLGACNYFRLFVKGFAEIADPLYELLRKDARFNWTEKQKVAVDTLKRKLCSSPILKYPDFNKEFHIYTDASLVGISACLMQEHKGVLHPLSYVSKCLSETQRRYSTTKKETLALIYGLEQFRELILYYPVHVYTDHMPLLGILKRKTKDACITRWCLLVQEYKITLHYLPGKENIFSDVLSRLVDVRDQCSSLPEELDDKLLSNLLSIEEEKTFQEMIPVKMSWNEEELRKAQQNDANCSTIIKNLISGGAETTNKISCFRMLNKVLYVRRNIKRGENTNVYLVPYVPESLMRKAFESIHTESSAGHQGFERTMKLFVKNYYNSYESKHIKNCAQNVNGASRRRQQQNRYR